MSGRVSPKVQKKRIKFLAREDTLFQPIGCSTNSDTDSISSSLSSTRSVLILECSFILVFGHQFYQFIDKRILY